MRVCARVRVLALATRGRENAKPAITDTRDDIIKEHARVFGIDPMEAARVKEVRELVARCLAWLRWGPRVVAREHAATAATAEQLQQLQSVRDCGKQRLTRPGPPCLTPLPLTTRPLPAATSRRRFGAVARAR